MWALMMLLNRRRRRRRSGLHNDDTDETPRFEFPQISIGSSRQSTLGERDMRDLDSVQHLPLMYSLARSWAWEAVSHRCRTHPHEASAEFVDEHGDNILHWTVFGRPSLEIIRDLLQACPKLARMPNQNGEYPLHVASSFRASESVISLLVKSFPEAAGLPTHSGTYVLHLLCDYGTTYGVLHHVLRTKESIASLSKEDPIYQRKPLHILNGRKNMRSCQRARDTMRALRLRIRMMIAAGEKSRLEDINFLKRKIIEDFANDDTWLKASLLLVAEATQKPLSSGGVDPCEVLHASIYIEDCPPSFQEWAILLYEEFLRVPSKNDGRLPLHVAANRGNTGLLLDLVEACPSAAAVRDIRGDLPLHLALRQKASWRWDDGLGALIEAFPDAIEDLRLTDSVYPYIWSKLSTRESLFNAVRSYPRNFGKSSQTICSC